MSIKTKLAMFDLDGTLFDTRKVNYNAYKKALQKYNIELDYTYFCNECNGRKFSDFLPSICGFNDERIEDIHQLKKKYYSSFLSYAVKNTALFSIIERLKDKYYIVLVTTASKKNVDELLKHFQVGDFDLIISQEDVHNAKPNPEGYLLGLNYFQMKPEDVIIFEDSNIGVEAASKVTKNVYVVKGYN